MEEEAPIQRRIIPDDGSHRLLECPICMQIFRDPKLLPCGHSICSGCCVKIGRNNTSPLCPVCRDPTNSQSESWPINFGLRDMVQHHLQTLEEHKFVCALCDRRITADNCWFCVDCRRIVCSQCALKFHQNHELMPIDDLVRQKEDELLQWRQTVLQKMLHNINARRTIESNKLELLRISDHLSNLTLPKKLVPQLRAEEKSFLRDLLEVGNRFQDITAFGLIDEESKISRALDRNEHCTKSLTTNFTRLPDVCHTMLAEQSETIKRQTDALNALRKCESAIEALFSLSAESNVASAGSSSEDIKDAEFTR